MLGITISSLLLSVSFFRKQLEGQREARGNTATWSTQAIHREGGSPQERVGPRGPEEGEWLGEVERAEEALLAAQGRGLC